MKTIRQRFIDDYNSGAEQVLVTAIKLPTGAIETITNTQQIGTKLEYILNAYDDEFKLKNNPAIQIVGYLLV